MTTYIEAPNLPPWKMHSDRYKSIFLAGGITGCVDWQSVARAALEGTYDFILNPRRADFDLADKDVTEEQIEWEVRHLGLCGDIMFWFSSETVQPITLFELGANLHFNRGNLFVGCDPDYSRRFDVVTQLKLARPDIHMWNNLDDMLEHIVQS